MQKKECKKEVLLIKKYCWTEYIIRDKLQVNPITIRWLLLSKLISSLPGESGAVNKKEFIGLLHNNVIKNNIYSDFITIKKLSSKN